MRCPTCGADSGVTETRETANGLRRRRRCVVGHRFTTHELVVIDPPSARDGRMFLVSQTKLEEVKAAIDRLTDWHSTSHDRLAFRHANDRADEPISADDPVLTD